MIQTSTNMKKTILLVLAAIGLFLLPSSKGMAQATSTREQRVVDLAGLTYTTCDGTEVTLQGTETFDFHRITNKNKAATILHITSDATATDAAGNTYKALESIIEKEQISLVDGSVTFYANGQQHLVSQGNAPNFTFHIQYKFTVAPDGTFTVVRDRVFTSCD